MNTKWLTGYRGSYKKECTFCQELNGGPSHFSAIYGNQPPSRILYDDGVFVVFPAIGQLLPGWLIIATKTHVETMAELPPAELRRLGSLIYGLRSSPTIEPHPLAFEHGAKEETGGACGIYHAHIHLIPVPEVVRSIDIHPTIDNNAASLVEALLRLGHSKEYVVCIDTGGEVTSCDLAQAGLTLPSQFLRQRLRQLFELERPWDWRSYGAEQALLQVLDSSGALLSSLTAPSGIGEILWRGPIS